MKRIVYGFLILTMGVMFTACGKENVTTQEMADTVGGKLVATFQEACSEKPDATPQELADIVMANEIIPFEGVTMPVEPGLLSGFGNTEISGFEEGVMFSPMIGSIPFVGYVFTVSDGTDVDAFIKTLRDNADPRWNICTEADETVVENSGSRVFFLMCPSAFEE